VLVKETTIEPRQFYKTTKRKII